MAPSNAHALQPVHCSDQAPPPAASRFTVSYAARPAGAPRSPGQSPGNSPGHDDQAREELLRRQRQELAMQHQARHQAFVERHEDAVVSSVPLEVRLRCLLAEGRKFERDRAARRIDEPEEMRSMRMRYIDAGYRNLIQDVHRRAAVIASHNPPAPHQHALGSEAIGCFSSMLPWTEGVVVAERTPPESPLEAAASADFASFRGRKKLPPGVKGSTRAASAIAAARRDDEGDATRPVRSSTPEPIQPYRWSIPHRLATDTRKLAAVTAARRQRLQGLSPLASPGSPPNDPSPFCRSQPFGA